jgi:transaldolase
MQCFVDTADSAEIKSLAAGRLPDVATNSSFGNPSLVTKTGKEFTDIIRETRAIVPALFRSPAPGPLA